VDDTWTAREMPVLSAVVALLERSYMVTVSDIAERTGLDQEEVARSLDALDPAYVDFRRTETGGDPRFWYVLKVTPEARRQVGQWPTPESLVDRLAAAFLDAANREPDPAVQGELRQTAAALSGAGRQASMAVAAEILNGAHVQQPSRD
jgi:CRISPR/Cas system endoribonuclease Cas6 (RAMP superfamily)